MTMGEKMIRYLERELFNTEARFENAEKRHREAEVLMDMLKSDMKSIKKRIAELRKKFGIPETE